MKRSAFLVAAFTAVLTLVLPFVGGSGPSLFGNAESAYADTSRSVPLFATAHIPAVEASTASATKAITATLAANRTDRAAALKVDSEHLAQKPVPKPKPKPKAVVSSGNAAADRASGTPARRAAAEAKGVSCPGAIGGSPGGAPGRTSGGGVPGTTSGDLASFAAAYNAIRVANCLHPVPPSNIRYDSCMEERLFWMAEDPSTDPASAWGHAGSKRSDGVPARGCDGNLAGGSGNTGATVAQKWWASGGHRASLYRPSITGSMGGVCIYFAMTHGGIPNEPYGFTRASARWGGC